MEPPTKRKRVDSTGMTGPDGFTKTKPVAKPRPRTSVPVFQSAFDTGQVGNGINKPRSKASETAFQPNIEGGNSTSGTGSLAISRPASRPISVSTSSLPTTNQSSQTKSISKVSLPSKPLQVNKVPGPQFKKVKSSTSETPPKPISRMKVLPPPIMSTTPPSIALQSLPSKRLKALAPPLFTSSSLSPVDHKPIPQFLPIRLSTPPEKSMKTIGTTRVALATDVSLDGAAELASILLQQHHVEDESDGRSMPESKWGLQVSPQKGKQTVHGHGHGANRFIRGGLAAQASSILSHLNTSLALWSKEISLHFSTSGGGSHSSLKPDMRLQIVRIIHTPPTKTSSPSIPSLAICRREIPSKIAPFPFETPSQHASHSEFQYLLTLFSFVARPSPPGTAVRNPAHFQDNQEVWVWKPWRTVSIVGLGRSHRFSQVFTIGDDVNNLDDVSIERLFASLQDGTTSIKVALEDVAYLCDRFVIPH